MGLLELLQWDFCPGNASDAAQTVIQSLINVLGESKVKLLYSKVKFTLKVKLYDQGQRE